MLREFRSLKMLGFWEYFSIDCGGCFLTNGDKIEPEIQRGGRRVGFR